MFSGNNPDDDFNTVSLEGFITPGCTATPCVAANLRRPFFAGGYVPNVLGVGGNFGWTGRVQAYFNEAHNWYKAMQARFTQALFGRVVCAGQLHTAEGDELR